MKKQKIDGKLLALVILIAVLAVGAVLYFTVFRAKEAPRTAGFAPRLDTKTACTINVVGHYENFEALEAEFNRFSAFYPNVEMNYVYLDDYKNIISTALTSSEAPDIFFTYPSWTDQDYASAENLADPKLGIDLSCIRGSLLYKDAAGNVPTVPVYTTTYGMLVNESIFGKEKIAIPQTYAELLSACEALKKAGYLSPVMAYNNGSDMLFPMFYPYFCAQIQGNEKALQDLNAMADGAGEYMRGALELAADFMSRGYVDLDSCSQLKNNYEAVILRFFEGDVPMMMASANTVSGTEKRQRKSEAFTANPFPERHLHWLRRKQEQQKPGYGQRIHALPCDHRGNEPDGPGQAHGDPLRGYVAGRRICRLRQAGRGPRHQSVRPGAGGYARRAGAQGRLAGEQRQYHGGRSRGGLWKPELSQTRKRAESPRLNCRHCTAGWSCLCISWERSCAARPHRRSVRTVLDTER